MEKQERAELLKKMLAQTAPNEKIENVTVPRTDGDSSRRMRARRPLKPVCGRCKKAGIKS